MSDDTATVKRPAQPRRLSLCRAPYWRARWRRVQRRLRRASTRR